MRPLYVRLAVRLLLSLYIIVSCDKDTEVVDAFAFEIIEDHTESGFIYEGHPTALEIQVPREVSTTHYSFSYTLLEGKGYFETSDGRVMEEGAPSPMQGLRFRLKYMPLETGNHRVSIRVEDNKGYSGEKQINYSVAYAPFSVVLSPQSSEYIINAKNPIAVHLFRESTTEQQRGFELSYYVDGGMGMLYQGDTDFEPGSTIPLALGTSWIGYRPLTLGTHKIVTTVTAPDGATRIAELELEIRHLSFSFSVASAANQADVNEAVDIRLNLTNENPESTVTYTMQFTYGDDTIGTVDLVDEAGKKVFPGAYVPIEPGNRVYSFTTTDIGRKNLQFEVVDSNGQTQSDNVIVDIQTIPVTFKGSPESNTVFINQETPFNFELNPQGDTSGITYSLRFEHEQGNGVLYKNGQVLEPGFAYDIAPGAFSCVFKPSTLDQHALSFSVTDSNHQEVSVTIQVTAKPIDISFNASPAYTQMLVNERNPVTVSLIENNTYQGVSYALSYFISGGVGTLHDENGSLPPSEYFPLALGSNGFDFIPEQPGNYVLTFLLRDSNGQVLERTVQVRVDTTDFSFKATPGSSSVALGGDVEISFAILANSSENNPTYTMRYENSNNGVITFAGTAYAPGELIDLTSKVFSGTYRPQQTGTHALSFTVQDSNGVTREDSASIQVSNGSYIFTAAAAPASLLINELGGINFNLSQPIANPNATYSVAYELSGGNATLKDASGHTVQPGVYVPIGLGNSSWSFASAQKGAYGIEFIVRDNTGIEAKDHIVFEVAGNSFSFNATPTLSEALVGTTVPINMNIAETATQSGETYMLRFASSLNASVLFGGTAYTAGQPIRVPAGDFSVAYIGESPGNHAISFTVTSSSSLSVTKDIQLQCNPIVFDFTATAQSIQLFQEQATDLNFSITESKGSSTYQMRYVISGTNATITDARGTPLSAGAYYPVPTGNFSWSLLGTTVGDVDISFFAQNATGLEVSKSVSVQVNPRDYSFSAVAVSNEPNVGEETPVSFVINELGSAGASYTMYYSSTKQGVFTYAGVSYPPGATFTVSAGNSTGTYQGLTEGQHDIAFTVISSDGNQKTADVAIDFTGEAYTLSGAPQDNTIYPSEQTGLNFNIAETGSTATYQMKYSFRKGSGMIKDQYGNTINSNTYYPVSAGNFSWSLTGTQEGDVDMEFVVRSGLGIEQSVAMTVEVLKTDFAFEATAAAASGTVNTPVGINFTLMQQGEENLTYSMTFTSSGTGSFVYNGGSYAPGATITVTPGNSIGTYEGRTVGQHNIAFTITSNNSNQKTANIVIDFTGALYTFSGTPQDSRIYTTESTPLNFTTTGTGSNAYQMKYSFRRGTGMIKDQSGNTIDDNTYYPVPAGNFSWTLTGTQEGDVDMEFVVRSDSGTEKSVNLTVEVLKTDFTFGATTAVASEIINTPVGVSFTLAQQGEENVSYSISFSSSGTGTFAYNGTEYASGASIPLGENPGNFSGYYTGSTPGQHRITFTISGSNAVSRQDNVEITYTNPDFNIDLIYPEATLTEEKPQISLNLTDNDAMEYTLSYSITPADGSRVLRNGTVVGQHSEVDRGVTSMVFEFASAIQYQITYTITSHLGIQKHKTATIAVEHTPFVFDVETDSHFSYNHASDIELYLNGSTHLVYRISRSVQGGEGYFDFDNDSVLTQGIAIKKYTPRSGRNQTLIFTVTDSFGNSRTVHKSIRVWPI